MALKLRERSTIPEKKSRNARGDEPDQKTHALKRQTIRPVGKKKLRPIFAIDLRREPSFPGGCGKRTIGWEGKGGAAYIRKTKRKRNEGGQTGTQAPSASKGISIHQKGKEGPLPWWGATVGKKEKYPGCL